MQWDPEIGVLLAVVWNLSHNLDQRPIKAGKGGLMLNNMCGPVQQTWKVMRRQWNRGNRDAEINPTVSLALQATGVMR